MKNFNQHNQYSQTEIQISGLGVTSAIGQGKAAFISALLQAEHAFAVMQRPGRQYPISVAGEKAEVEESSAFLGAEISSLSLPESLSAGLLRTASFSGQVVLATLHEAWHDANLNEVDPARIGLVIGGSNFQQRELVQLQEDYRGRQHFLRPSYGFTFMDSDLCGLCTESFAIQGFAYTLGAASASGQAAILQAVQAVQSGQVDICIALGALMDLSYWECQGFRTMGAMGSDRYAQQPGLASRPFDQDRDGFIYGECCGAVVIERVDTKRRADANPYAQVAGWAMQMDGNRNPNPSLEGEVSVIEKTLLRAELEAQEIDYINPHGTGSTIGDQTELQALHQCGLRHAYINTTKSIIGHGLSAAGTMEVVATLLQMEAGRLHPSRNLDTPIEPSYNWVLKESIPHDIKNAITLSMGFGGVNTALCLQRY